MGAITISDFTGGLNFASTPLALKDGEQGPLESGMVQDVDFSHATGVLTRKGLGLGPRFAIPAEYIPSQNTAFGQATPSYTLTTVNGQPFVVQPGVELRIANHISSITGRSGSPYHLTSTLNFSGAVQYAVAELWSGNTQAPIALQATSAPVYTLYGNNQVFTFPAGSALVTPLWIAIRFLPTTTGLVSYLPDLNYSAGGVLEVGNNEQFLSIPLAPAFTSLVGPAYATSGVSGAITGLYDYRAGAPVSQTVLATSMPTRTLAWSDTSSAFAAITLPSGSVGSGYQQQDFCVSNDDVFVFGLDNGMPLSWDQESAAAKCMGWRPTPSNGIKAACNSYAISAIAGDTASVTAFASIGSGSTLVYYPWTFAGDTVAFYDASNNYLGYGSVTQVDTINSTVTFADSVPSTATHIGQGCAASANQTSGSIAEGSYNIMLVTTLKSGGFRASTELVHFVSAASSKIALTGLSINSDLTGGTAFGFDIDTQATQVYIQLNTQSVATTLSATAGQYYQVPAAYLTWTTATTSNVGNPVPNGTTSLVISNLTGLATQPSLTDTYLLPQDYFVMQMDTPRGLRYGCLYNGFLFTAGDPLNPNRVYACQYEAPNIFSRYGQTYGSYYEPATIGDGDHITGLHAWGGKFFILRSASIQMLYFTGNNAAPFQFLDVASTVGCINHFSIQDLPMGFVFLSAQGPAVCYGSYAMVLKSGWKVRNLFHSLPGTTPETAYPGALLEASPYDMGLISGQSWSTCSSGLDELKMHVYWCLGRAGDVVPSIQLVYDYQAGCFFERNIPVQVCASVLQPTGVRSIWFGSVLGVVSILDGADAVFSGNHPSTDQFIYLGDSTDPNTPNAALCTPIISVFDTPWMSMGDPGGSMRLDRMNLSFRAYNEPDLRDTASDVLVQEFSNYNPVAIAQRTYSDPTGAALFSTAFAGVINPLVAQGSTVKLRFIICRQNNSQVLVNAAKIYYTSLGAQL